MKKTAKIYQKIAPHQVFLHSYYICTGKQMFEKYFSRKGCVLKQSKTFKLRPTKPGLMLKTKLMLRRRRLKRLV